MSKIKFQETLPRKPKNMVPTVGFFGRSGPLAEGYALFEQLGIRDDFFSCLLFSTFSIVTNN